MPAPYPYGETVTRLREGPSPGRDPLGSPLPGTVVETEIHGCVVTPREAAPTVGGEMQQARDTVVVGLTVYAPPGTDIRTTDRIRIRGELYEVTGQPGDWGHSPFTGTRGVVQVAADRVTG